MVQGEFQFSATVSKSKTSDVKPKKKVAPAKTPRILTVTQVTRLIKTLTEENQAIGALPEFFQVDIKLGHAIGIGALIS